MIKASWPDWLGRRSGPDEASQPAPHGRVPPGSRVYAIGDIHGRHDLLAAQFARIDAHRRQHPVERAIEIYLGDYIDRGPDSRAVIDMLVARRESAEICVLSGNHEQLMLAALHDPEAVMDWVRVGAVATLMSYGIAVPPQPDVQRLTEAVARLGQTLPASHRAFLEGLEISVVFGDYFFVHAGVRPGAPLSAQRAEDMLWIRGEFLGYQGSFGKIVVHGHSPVSAPDIRANRINIDTGAYASGRLTCMVLEGDSIAFLSQ